MICPICKQRWAPLLEESSLLYDIKTEKVREKVFKNNTVRCCGDQDCLQMIDAMEAHYAEFRTGATYDTLVEETKKELAEGKIG